MGGARRRRLERLEGVAFDAVLVAVREDAAQTWLFELEQPQPAAGAWPIGPVLNLRRKAVS